MPRSRTIKASFYFDAPPAKVFKSLIAPNQLKRWLVGAAKLSPRKGGNYYFEWQGGYNHTGKVLDYEKDAKLSLLWPQIWNGKGIGNTRVTFKLKPKGDGTILQLTHAGFKRSGEPWAQTWAQTNSGWAYYLMNLKSVVEHNRDLRHPDDDF